MRIKPTTIDIFHKWKDLTSATSRFGLSHVFLSILEFELVCPKILGTLDFFYGKLN